MKQIEKKVERLKIFNVYYSKEKGGDGCEEVEIF